MLRSDVSNMKNMLNAVIPKALSLMKRVQDKIDDTVLKEKMESAPMESEAEKHLADQLQNSFSETISKNDFRYARSEIEHLKNQIMSWQA